MINHANGSALQSADSWSKRANLSKRPLLRSRWFRGPRRPAKMMMDHRKKLTRLILMEKKTTRSLMSTRTMQLRQIRQKSIKLNRAVTIHRTMKMMTKSRTKRCSGNCFCKRNWRKFKIASWNQRKTQGLFQRAKRRGTSCWRSKWPRIEIKIIDYSFNY